MGSPRYFFGLRRSRFLLLTLLPAYGLLSIPAANVVPHTEAAQVLSYSNIAVVLIEFSINTFRVDPPIIIAAFAVSNLAFWLPVAHLIDGRLQRYRRRRA